MNSLRSRAHHQRPKQTSNKHKTTNKRCKSTSLLSYFVSLAHLIVLIYELPCRHRGHNITLQTFTSYLLPNNVNVNVNVNTAPQPPLVTKTSNMEDAFISIFIALNVAFLAATAVWFRVDHSSANSRRYQAILAANNEDRPNTEVFMAEIQWLYSLRSNLLLWGCLMGGYLVYIGETNFMLWCFCILATINIVTDVIYTYEVVPLFSVVKKGHRMAALVIWTVAILYWIVKARG
jgi:hypothetical protein